MSPYARRENSATWISCAARHLRRCLVRTEHDVGEEEGEQPVEFDAAGSGEEGVDQLGLEFLTFVDT